MMIFGATGKINDVNLFFDQVQKFSKKNNIFIQIVNADLILGKEHVISAFFHTTRSFSFHTNSLDDMALEFLLYLSGERQISKAIKKVGITNQSNNFAIIIFSKDEDIDTNSLIYQILSKFRFNRDDALLNGNIQKMKRFGISDDELSTIPQSRYCDLILEKVALVDIIK